MIYLDNAATTKTLDGIAKLHSEYLTEHFYNPSAPYQEALEISNAINDAKQSILRLLKDDGQIIFTSSGTESDNLSIFGTKKPNNSRIIISAIEHAAVQNCALQLKQQGFDVVFCPVDSGGKVIESEFASLVNKNTSFVSIMHVNNLTGAINDIKNLCNIAKKANPSVIFHSDGVQAVGKINVNLNELGVDLYSLSGHKIHAPKGIGALYAKKGINLKPIIFGGGQEYNIRSSTENVAGIMSITNALKLAVENLSTNYAKATELNNYVRANIDGENIKIISDKNASPYILALALRYVRGEVMLHSLNQHNILIGTGSACNSKKNSKGISAAINLPKEYENGIVRLSFSSFTTQKEIEYSINTLNLEYLKLLKFSRG